MKLDVHMTTCHRSDVHCRPRPHEGPNWNVKPWTHDEKLKIAITCFETLYHFCDFISLHGHEVSLTLLDDGSDLFDIEEEFDIFYLKAVSTNRFKVDLKKYSKRGSSGIVNAHFEDMQKDPPDYVLHVEDDNLMFNPLKLDWLKIIDSFKLDNPTVFTFRSGLPVDPNDKGYYGDWGPKGSIISKTGIPGITFNRMGNAHHLMKWEDYKLFFPLQGNTGGCEVFMNNRLHEMHGINIEPQIHVHAFHSHMWKYPVNTGDLRAWHKTGEGFEFGISDMDIWLFEGKPVTSYLSHEILELTNYAY